MTTLATIGLAVTVLIVPACCAYVIVKRLRHRRNRKP